MAKRLELYEMHSFPTSSNSRHHTTVLNAVAFYRCWLSFSYKLLVKMSVCDWRGTNRNRCTQL